MTMRGSKGNKKGFFFQAKLSENIARIKGYESGEVDETLYCESIGTTSRDKVDNYVLKTNSNVTKFISAKCPGNFGAFQMSSFTVPRQLRFLEHKVGFVPQSLQDFCYAYFGHVDYDIWMSANSACGVDISNLCPEDEVRRQRTLGINIPADVKDRVLQYLNSADVKEAFVQMHLISGFTDRAADYQIYHPAKTKKDIDFSSDNFYAINLEMLKSDCLNWKWAIGPSTINFGPLNWKVRGGGGKSCTPTKGSYHNAQCFSGVGNLERSIGGTDAFFQGTLPQILKHVYKNQ